MTLKSIFIKLFFIFFILLGFFVVDRNFSSAGIMCTSPTCGCSSYDSYGQCIGPQICSSYISDAFCACPVGETASCESFYPAVVCGGDVCGYPSSCKCTPAPSYYACDSSSNSCYASDSGSYSTLADCNNSCSNSGPSTPSFRLTVTQPSVTAYQGDTATYTVNIEPLNSFLGKVNLSYTSCPTNASCNFDVSSVTITDANVKSTIFNVGTNASVALQTYTTNLKGTYDLDANQTSATDVYLTVQQNPKAICNGTWQTLPGGGNTPSQPIGNNITQGNYSVINNVGLVIRGMDNQIYYRICGFSGSDCYWNSNWTSLGGSTLYSPYTFNGACWDVVRKDPVDLNKWDRINCASYPSPGWGSWFIMGPGSDPWGSPYRFNDKLGRTWQVRRNSDTSISYACGIGTNVCITPAFDSSKSGISPTSVNVNDNVTIRCDMSVNGADFIMPSFTGGQLVSFDGFEETTAKFTFKATQSGTHTVSCNTSVTGQNFCASSNSIGNLTVTGTALKPTINLNPTSMSFSGVSRTNLAAASSGAVATSSSEHSSGNFPASGAINGDRRGVNWGNNGGWNDNTLDVWASWADWLQVVFNGPKSISEIDVYTLADSYPLSADPGPTDTFSLYGITDFSVLYDNGSGWQIVPGGSINNNNLIWKKLTFPTINNVNRIIVVVGNSKASFSRIVEVEAYSSSVTPPAQNLTITNTGPAGTTLNWTWSRNPSAGAGTWCRLQNSSGVDIPINTGGSLTSGASVTTKVAVNDPSNIGTFTDCGIRISDSNATNNPQNVSLTYVVTASPGICPAGSVSLSPNSVNVGQTSSLSAPAGFTGGSFSSSNPAIATVSGSTATAVSAGSSNITGTGWTYTPNGAVNCSLTAASLTVTATAPPPPTNPGANNSYTDALVACEKIKLSWTDNSNNETGFKLYKDGVFTGITMPASSPASQTGSTLTYEYAPGDFASHTYAVSAIAGSVESAKTANTGLISSISCNANLGTSDKDIIGVNGVSYITSDCSGGNEFPSGVKYKIGDTVEFSIKICNTAPAVGGFAAKSITIVDTLTNLARYDNSKALTDPLAWGYSSAEMVYEAPVGVTLNSIQVVSGTEPADLKLRFILNGSIPAGNSAKLRLKAKTALPDSYVSNSSRFQNSASINYIYDNNSSSITVSKASPLLLFTRTSAPVKREIAP